MRKLMEYHIISGRVVETRRSYLPCRGEPKKQRGTRRAGASSEKKINLNERQEKQRLARILNTNFEEGGYMITLKYSGVRLPESYDAAREEGEKLMRKLRLLCKKEGVELRRVLVTANWSPKRNGAARFHHHVVINKIPLAILERLWPDGEMYIETLRAGDLSHLAAYLCDNVRLEEKGRKKWSPSRNLQKPIFTEPTPVQQVDGIQAPEGAEEISQTPTYNEDGRQVGCYMRCTLPARPEIRGNRIYLKKAKRGGHKRE